MRLPDMEPVWKVINHTTWKARFDDMKAFFGGVGQGDEAGVWEDVPKPFPNFRKEMRRLNEKAAKKREAQDVGA